MYMDITCLRQGKKKRRKKTREYIYVHIRRAGSQRDSWWAGALRAHRGNTEASLLRRRSRWWFRRRLVPAVQPTEARRQLADPSIHPGIYIFLSRGCHVTEHEYCRLAQQFHDARACMSGTGCRCRLLGLLCCHTCVRWRNQLVDVEYNLTTLLTRREFLPPPHSGHSSLLFIFYFSFFPFFHGDFFCFFSRNVFPLKIGAA
jgi:hypothetical protein